LEVTLPWLLHKLAQVMQQTIAGRGGILLEKKLAARFAGAAPRRRVKNVRRLGPREVEVREDERDEYDVDPRHHGDCPDAVVRRRSAEQHPSDLPFGANF